MGVASSIDLLRTAFNADRSGLDAVMDVVKVTVDPTTAQATIKNLITQAEIRDDLASKTDTAALPTVIAAPATEPATATTPQPASVSGSRASAVTARLRRRSGDVEAMFMAEAVSRDKVGDCRG